MIDIERAKNVIMAFIKETNDLDNIINHNLDRIETSDDLIVEMGRIAEVATKIVNYVKELKTISPEFDTMESVRNLYLEHCQQ